MILWSELAEVVRPETNPSAHKRSDPCRETDCTQPFEVLTKHFSIIFYTLSNPPSNNSKPTASNPHTQAITCLQNPYLTSSRPSFPHPRPTAQQYPHNPNERLPPHYSPLETPVRTLAAKHAIPHPERATDPSPARAAQHAKPASTQAGIAALVSRPDPAACSAVQSHRSAARRNTLRQLLHGGSITAPCIARASPGRAMVAGRRTEKKFLHALRGRTRGGLGSTAR